MTKIAKKKTESPPQFSKSISDFCSTMNTAVKDFEWNKKEMAKLDMLTQDYLHKLELSHLDYKERAKVATKLSACRRKRRMCKDTWEILEPLAQYLDSEKGKQLMNMMREALGKTRKTEEKMQSRVYYHRVLDEAEIRD